MGFFRATVRGATTGSIAETAGARSSTADDQVAIPAAISGVEGLGSSGDLLELTSDAAKFTDAGFDLGEPGLRRGSRGFPGSGRA